MVLPNMHVVHDFLVTCRLTQCRWISGDTYILYNQQVKGNKRELIQFGVPIFGQIKEDATDKFQKSMASFTFKCIDCFS